MKPIDSSSSSANIIKAQKIKNYVNGAKKIGIGTATYFLANKIISDQVDLLPESSRFPAFTNGINKGLEYIYDGANKLVSNIKDTTIAQRIKNYTNADKGRVLLATLGGIALVIGAIKVIHDVVTENKKINKEFQDEKDFDLLF